MCCLLLGLLACCPCLGLFSFSQRNTTTRTLTSILYKAVNQQAVQSVEIQSRDPTPLIKSTMKAPFASGRHRRPAIPQFSSRSRYASIVPKCPQTPSRQLGPGFLLAGSHLEP